MAQDAPGKIGLLRFLSNNSGGQYVIPVYQRNYTWKVRDVRKLMDDVKAILSGERKKHFVGIIIYLEQEITETDSTRIERSVIDGQQRLTTVFLTLYAIKDLILKDADRLREAYNSNLKLGKTEAAAQRKEEEERLRSAAREIDQKYLMAEYWNEKPKYKLKPLVSQDGVYKKIVERKFNEIDKEEESSPVYRNFKELRRIISSFIGEEKYTRGQILDALDKLEIVFVPIGNEDNPQKVFESINATGVKLESSDLIRNFMLMPVASELQESFFENYWRKIERLVSSEGKELVLFFKYFVISKKQTDVREGDVYNEFTNWFEEFCNSNENKDEQERNKIENVFAEVVKYARCYNTLYKKDIQDIDSVLQPSIEEYRSIAQNTPTSFLLELLRKTDDELVSKEAFSEILTIINTYLVRRSLCNASTNQYNDIFPLLCKNIFIQGRTDYSDLVSLFKINFISKYKGQASRELPNDKTLDDYLGTAKISTKNNKVLFTVFKKIENHSNPAPVSLKSINIEHLMPQTPTKEWLTTLGIDKETYDSYKDRLGNLTFASSSDNSRMGNKPWEYKNKVLANTKHLKINEDVLCKDGWTTVDIDGRTKHLINQIKILYPYVAVEDINKIPVRLKNYNATGYWYPDSNCVDIEEGTILRDTMESTASDYAITKRRREDLIDKGVIDYIDNTLVFITDYTFTSPSGASTIILGRSSSGYEDWITEDGTLLSDYKKYL